MNEAVWQSLDDQLVHTARIQAKYSISLFLVRNSPCRLSKHTKCDFAWRIWHVLNVLSDLLNSATFLQVPYGNCHICCWQLKGAGFRVWRSWEHNQNDMAVLPAVTELSTLSHSKKPIPGSSWTHYNCFSFLKHSEVLKVARIATRPWEMGNCHAHLGKAGLILGNLKCTISQRVQQLPTLIALNYDVFHFCVLSYFLATNSLFLEQTIRSSKIRFYFWVWTESGPGKYCTHETDVADQTQDQATQTCLLWQASAKWQIVGRWRCIM